MLALIYYILSYEYGVYMQNQIIFTIFHLMLTFNTHTQHLVFPLDRMMIKYENRVISENFTKNYFHIN